MAPTLDERDDDVVYIDHYGNPYSNSWWYTKEGIIVKWVLFFAFITFVTFYFFVGRALARRRVRNNKKPFFGTAWLLSRRERGLVDPRYAGAAWPGQNGPYYQYPAQRNHQQAGYYGPQQQYPMGDMYAPPPPVYDGHRPPVYDANGAAGTPGDVGAAKIDPNQGQTSGVGPAAPGANDFAPPSGPPPARS
ncbi:uncharacterized protein B0I36DRAFT_368395 [Microdochium trichocladiopsis]|uniref:Chitin synthesis regulation, congo red resistance, RCR protein n=1 Tax=Microdochium trichocladiopsis TaxID=1682393 RepID=A0A9P8XUI0_9PEZI|nr:uncharacterized protein B0I36DRAFT_368395 [Microdochium trichocladiopsis]KAH7018369.1 hypothetical protein B0I36DRAFT_368395 [Microdochium trichocladiopsis]